MIVYECLDSVIGVWDLICTCDKFRSVSEGEKLYRYFVIQHTDNGKDTYSLEECES